MSARTLSIDLYSDVVCPWCFVGLTRLDQVLAELDADVKVDVRHHTYLLMPDTPDEGLDLIEHLRSKYGRDPRQMFERVESEAREAGLSLDLMKVRRSYPTVKAQTLIRFAHAKGTHRALAQDLFRAYFQEIRDIGTVGELTAIAAPHGFDADEVAGLLNDPQELAITRREAQRSSALGITGVPFFIFQGKFALSGAQPPEAFRQAVVRALEA